MVIRSRKSYEAGFKARVALEAIKGERTRAPIASSFVVLPNQVQLGLVELWQVLADIFSDRRKSREQLGG